MPPPRRRFRRRRRVRHSGRPINSAWKVRRKRRTGLVQRTLLSNRRQIRDIKKCQETKMVENWVATDQNEYEGQAIDDLKPNNLGEDTAVSPAQPFAGKLLKVVQGTASDQRIGSWIHMKSLTIKYCIRATAVRERQQTVWLMLVLDKNPVESTPQLGDVLSSYATQQTTPPTNRFALAYQNLDKTGLKNRYVILWKKKHTVSHDYNTGASVQVPAITQENVGDVMRPAYTPTQACYTSPPSRVYGSHTITNRYKLNYGASTNDTPSGETTPLNQQIVLFAWTDYVSNAYPTVQYYSRFRFHDT